METTSHVRHSRTRVNGIHDTGRPRPSNSRNKQWVASENGQRSSGGTPYHSDSDWWEGGDHRGGRGSRGVSRGGRGKFPNVSFRASRNHHTESESSNGTMSGFKVETIQERVGEDVTESEEPALETAEERDKFWQELVKAREVERKKAIAEGKMDDPNIPKRLEDAICIVGTCVDMCPRFERYRRERENNLFEWEVIPGTKRVDHKRAVKMYERAAGDKTLPSDLRPPHILKRTLDYLFHDLLPRGGFSETFNFIRDRSRAVRNDFTMQHSYGYVAIECHDRCARFHILALHLERNRESFSIALEEQQLMNTLQSLKEFYEDQRGRYESPTELEMRVYHRLIHIRDQRERHDDIPEYILLHPVFKLTTDFRLHVQRKSAPITKVSKLIVDTEGMEIFGNLANVLREQGNIVMIYLVACILERHFGREAIDNIEGIRRDLSLPDIIDGVLTPGGSAEASEDSSDDVMYDEVEAEVEGGPETTETEPFFPLSVKPSTAGWTSSAFGPQSSASAFGTSAPRTSSPKQTVTAFSSIATTPNVFSTPSPFGVSAFPSSSTSVFGLIQPESTFAAAGASGNPVQALNKPTFDAAPSIMSQNPFPIQSVAPSSTPGTFTPAAPVTLVTPPTSQPPSVNIPSTLAPSAAQSASFFDPGPGSKSSDLITGWPSSFNNGLSVSTNGTTPPVLNPKASVFTPMFATRSSPSQFGSSFQPSSTPSLSPIPVTFTTPPGHVDAPTTPSAIFSSSGSKTLSPPPSQKKSVTPPVLARINTNTSSIISQGTQLATPTGPPPLPKHQPISLPSTPTIMAERSNPLFSVIKGNSEASISGSSQEVLSPIFIHTPTLSRSSVIHNFSPHGKSKFGQKLKEGNPPSPFINGKGKSPAKAPIDDADLQAKVNVFLQRSNLVKSTFRRWHQLILQRAAWLEACQQSDAYGQKVRRQQRYPNPYSDKKRKISTNSVTVVTSPQKKRARRISSDYHPPRTDEELARRFKEDLSDSSFTIQNHEEHERRWAQGSFLSGVRDHIKAKLVGATIHPSWKIWLSMNLESDATAIWLERKFDVPASGKWVSEVVFSVPLTNTKDPTTDPDSPGLIVFECSPLEGVTDELERKYRILDDCTRLRNIIKAFSPKHHFIPSLLIISWMEENKTNPASDFTSMVNNLVDNHTLHSSRVFSITANTKDLDVKLEEALDALPLDLEGKLVRCLTIRGAFKLFEPRFTSFISEWIDNCFPNGNFNWHLFSQLVQVVVAIVNNIAHFISTLASGDISDILPAFDGGDVVDNNSAYDSITTWLSSTGFGEDAENIVLNLQSHRNIGQEFPARDFFEQIWDLVQFQTEVRLELEPQTKLYFFNADVTSTLEAQQLIYQDHQKRLGQVFYFSVRRSPRRRSVSIDTELTNGHLKRRRLSSPVGSNSNNSRAKSPSYSVSPPYINGRSTPSPTPTNASLVPSEGSQTATPVVTVAMLRALARDMKKKYGSQ